MASITAGTDGVSWSCEVVPAAMRRARVLIAEDNAHYAAFLTRLLESHHEILAVVSSGERLVDLAAARRPDVIVADIGLDGLDGVAATMRIHAQFPALPIVLVTAGDALAMQSLAVEAGAITVLHKSRASELIDVLQCLGTPGSPCRPVPTSVS